jgi:hypothetical protein
MMCPAVDNLSGCEIRAVVPFLHVVMRENGSLLFCRSKVDIC